MTEYNPQNQKIGGVGQQLNYPLDYVSQEILSQFIKSAYPVGSIYTSVVSTNPSTLFGFGTWTAFATGRCLVGIDSGQTEFDTVEETGGAKTHTLSIAEMPAHTHSSIDFSGGPNNLAGGAGLNTSGVTGSTGGGGAHNNLQPYIVVYMWKRTN